MLPLNGCQVTGRDQPIFSLLKRLRIRRKRGLFFAFGRLRNFYEKLKIVKKFVIAVWRVPGW
jgi:hypothetical protein